MINPITNVHAVTPVSNVGEVSPVSHISNVNRPDPSSAAGAHSSTKQSRESGKPVFETGQASGNVSNQAVKGLYEAYDEKTLKRMGVIECATCASRTYQDGSDDPGVSFKSPTHISPEASASAVRSHEQEHVVREQAQAEKTGGQVVAQSVTVYSSVCPECGRSYTAGGLTRTTVRHDGTETEDSYKGQMMDARI